MVQPFLRGGKTSPRLLKDLQYYNPQNVNQGDDNVLTLLTPPFNENTSEVYPHRIRTGDCQHDWMIKENQCSLLENGPLSGEQYGVAACCVRCRSHVNLRLVVGDNPDSGWPCSGFHHFVHDSRKSQGFVNGDLGSKQAWDDDQFFQCAAPGCPCTLEVNMSSPRLSLNSVDLLTNREKINARAKAAIAADPERMEGIAVPAPVTVLNNLKTYILDATKNDTPRDIAEHNKKWLVSLGDPLRELLERLGFTRGEGHWKPPKPTVNAPTPLTGALDLFLDDILVELNALIYQQPQQDRQQLQVRPDLGPAQGEMATLLNCRDYPKNPGSRGQANISYDEEHPWYGTLGALMDFRDDLLKEAYNKQIACDSQNEPYYFDSLKGIAQGRNSEDLQILVVTQESEGVVGISGIEEAYCAFNFHVDSWGLNDETIIGSFEARVTDAPRQEHDLRQALSIIGKHRKSEKIRDFAANSVTTYEQAMSWLGVSEETSDEFIVTFAQVKINDNPSQEVTTRKAVEIIAKHRNSPGLSSWLQTGEVTESTYTPEQAFARLGCATNCTEDTLAVAYKDAVKQQPSQKSDLQRALRALAEHLDSSMLRNYCEGDSPNYSNPEEWPVGLENLSNACHFNSTLQMLFSLKPFRNLIINSEELKKPLDPEEIKRFTVGNRRIYRSEVRHGQEFLDDMRHTFNAMITSPVGYVLPKEEMVENAFDPSVVSPDAKSPIGGGPMKDPFEGIDTTMTRSSSNTAIGDIDQTAELGEDAKRAYSTESAQRGEQTDNADADKMQVDETQTGNDSAQLPALQPVSSAKDTSFRQQQDVTETAGNMFFRLCCAIAPTNKSDPAGSEQKDPIIDLFFGRSKDLNADTGEKTSDQHSTLFNIVSVNTRDTLEEAIESNWCYVPEGSKIYRYTSVVKLPPVVQVQINRRQYTADRGAWKDDHDVQIPETLYLGHFLDDADDEVKKQWRDIARKILAIDRDLGDRKDLLEKKPEKAETSLAPSQLLGTTSAALDRIAGSLGDDDEDVELFKKVSADLLAIQEDDKKDLAEIEEKIGTMKEELKQMRSNLPKQAPYRLHSVFVHRGTATSGHYFVYIYDFKKKMWRKYNDKIVEEADPGAAAIFHNYQQQGFSLKDTPFFLTYVAADKVDEFVDPVCRAIEMIDTAAPDGEEDLPEVVIEGIPAETEGPLIEEKVDSSIRQHQANNSVW